MAGYFTNTKGTVYKYGMIQSHYTLFIPQPDIIMQITQIMIRNKDSRTQSGQAVQEGENMAWCREKKRQIQQRGKSEDADFPLCTLNS